MSQIRFVLPPLDNFWQNASHGLDNWVVYCCYNLAYSTQVLPLLFSNLALLYICHCYFYACYDMCQSCDYLVCTRILDETFLLHQQIFECKGILTLLSMTGYRGLESHPKNKYQGLLKLKDSNILLDFDSCNSRLTVDFLNLTLSDLTRKKAMKGWVPN